MLRPSASSKITRTAHGPWRYQISKYQISKKKQPRGIAIIALGATARYAPFDDPAWVRWTLNDGYIRVPQQCGRSTFNVGAVFEMHPEEHYTGRDGNGGYIEDHEERLAAMKIPVFLAFPNPKIPNAVLYPIDEVLQYFHGPDYFCSTLAFMIPLAIMVIEESQRRGDGMFAKKIGFWGCDMQFTSEWAKERACVEFWAGRAVERGIELIVPPQSPLLKSTFRYGYETETIDWRKRLIDGRRTELGTMLRVQRKLEKDAHEMAEQIEGMIMETGWHDMHFTDRKPESAGWKAQGQA